MSVRYESNRGEVDRAIDSAHRLAMDKAATFIMEAVKKKLSGPGPSSPGSPPGVQTGILRRSITHDGLTGDVINPDIRRIGPTVGPDVYARAHEFGGRNPGGQPYFISKKRPKRKGASAKISASRWIVFVRRTPANLKRFAVTKPFTIAKRPFLRPALYENQEQAIQLYQDTFDAEMRR